MESMFCKYCWGEEKPLLVYSNTFDEVTEVYITKDEDLRLKIDGDGFVEEDINFCPMCGRDLRK